MQLSISSARIAVAVFALIAIAFTIWSLESQRSGLTITHLNVGTTPATVYHRADQPPAPAVIITHGFAGSRQLMEAYALTLAQAGYVSVALDFEGHGANSKPMSGDITSIDGTTQLLMREIGRVTETAMALPYVDGSKIALLGHSMASDIIVRQAIADPSISAVIAISMFSQAVTKSQPPNLLVITGEWEGALREEAIRVLRLVDESANEGDTHGTHAAGTARRIVVAPSVEHVGVLYSATGLREARAWLDATFEREAASEDRRVAATGGAIALLLSALVALAWPLASLLPQAGPHPSRIDSTTFWLAALLPAIITPLVLTLVETRLLPVLVADYLAVHFFVYGSLALAILLVRGVRLGPIAWAAGLAFAAYGIFVFGGAIDRYASSFMPHAGRLSIILAIALGTVPYMLADSLLCEAGHARWWRVLVARTAFLVSLGAAVALDFERLFFLLIILPVIVLFYVLFGLMGGWVGRRTHAPIAVGLGLGLILAWALGVTFPMFQA